MNKAELEQTVRTTLTEVAPEVDPGSVDPDKSFRDQFDFDSMDYLSLMMGLNDKLGIHIPEIDYPKLSSLSSCVEYIEEKLKDEAGEA